MEDLTLRQKQVTQLIEAGLSQYRAAEILGVSRPSVQASLYQAKAKGWKKSTGDAITPDKMQMHGQSVLYGPDGEAKLAWHKYSAERAFSADFVEGLVKRVEGKGKLSKWKKPPLSTKDICAEVIIADLHMGMRAYAKETGGEDYDTDIAAKRLMQAVQSLLYRFTSPSVIRIVLLGDQCHFDDNSNATKQSGHVLDVDTRYSLVLKKLIAAVWDVVCLVSEYAPKLEIYVIPGNHDEVSSYWLKEVLKAFWHNEPRIDVCDQDTYRKYAQWGDSLSVYAHGDRIKPADIAKVVAAEQPKLWGSTKHRYFRAGHFHHRKTIAPVVVNEQSGIEITYLSSLAASDAWHSHSGFVGSQRAVQGFELSKTHGQISQFYSHI